MCQKRPDSINNAVIFQKMRLRLKIPQADHSRGHRKCHWNSTSNDQLEKCWNLSNSNSNFIQSSFTFFSLNWNWKEIWIKWTNFRSVIVFFRDVQSLSINYEARRSSIIFTVHTAPIISGQTLGPKFFFKNDTQRQWMDSTNSITCALGCTSTIKAKIKIGF